MVCFAQFGFLLQIASNFLIMNGEKITISNGKLNVPDNAIIPFIIGDGTGPDIWNATHKVLEKAVEKAYDGKRSIVWKEVLAGEKAFNETESWLPDATIDDIAEYLVAIKGPLTTPVGGGIRSLNVALRQKLDLYTCLRPVRYFSGVPSPMSSPEKVDMVIFRENTEDIYAGIEFKAGTEANAKFMELLKEHFPEEFAKIRFGTSERMKSYTDVTIRDDEDDSTVEVGLGIKPVSRMGSNRLIRAAIQYAIDNNRKSVTLVHKGNIMKFTEGAFRDWGYEIAKAEFGAVELDGGPWCTLKNPNNGEEIIIKDVIADAFLQQILLRPAEYDVIATLNLNGDYVSDALAAEVGGIGIAPGANINYDTGVALFEATHGTAPKYAGLDKVNPGSLILSGCMMLEYMGWNEAAEMIYAALEKTILSKKVTYDFERLMDDATLLKCSEFGAEIISNM